MRNDPVAAGLRIEAESDYVDFVAFSIELASKLTAPIFQAPTGGIETLQYEGDFHPGTAKNRFCPERMRNLFTMSRRRSTVPSVSIHPTAVVSSKAELASDVTIGPYAVVEAEVSIGAGCEVGAHAVIKRYTTLGRRNRVFEHATVGGEPQDLKFRGEPSGLIIGDDNIIRENVTIHRATGEGSDTRIGSRNYLMVGVHIAHNCILDDDCIFANGAALAGHILVEDHVYLSNEVGVHQFVRLGRYALVGGKAKVVQDVLPFLITDGNPSRVRGLNSVGLRRAGFSCESRLNLKRACHLLMRSHLPLEIALEDMERLDDANVRHLVHFVRASRRGFAREHRASAPDAKEPTRYAAAIHADFID
jgi:UDP-N-acetylglucosamine acyltransferase